VHGTRDAVHSIDSIDADVLHSMLLTDSIACF